MDIDRTQADLLLSTTRSVRKRLDLERPVEREVILECIRLAVQAPTGGNSQTWRWMVVDDPDKIAALGEIYGKAARAYLPMYRTGPTLTEQTERVLDSADYLGEIMGRVPAMVIPVSTGRLTTDMPAMAAAFYGSIVPAVWSFQLALRARGLGSCFTTLHLMDEAAANELLGMPDDVTAVALLPVAYTKGTDFKPAQRGPVERITYFNEWKATPEASTPAP
jgi:nitroreductase